MRFVEAGIAPGPNPMSGDLRRQDFLVGPEKQKTPHGGLVKNESGILARATLERVACNPVLGRNHYLHVRAACSEWLRAPFSAVSAHLALRRC
jgi:hypothetical protein